MEFETLKAPRVKASEVVGNGGSPSRLGGLRERRKLPQRGPGHSKKPAKYKNKIAFNISKLLSKSLLSTGQCKNCKKYRTSVASMDQNSEHTH